jgi:hypothetical protein
MASYRWFTRQVKSAPHKMIGSSPLFVCFVTTIRAKRTF